MFTLQVTDIFAIRGRGIVLMGEVTGAKVSVGDRVLLVSSGALVLTTVAAIEKNKILINVACPGEKVAMLVRGVEPDALVGGVEHVEVESGVHQWSVVNLRIEAVPKKWWEIWK